MLPTENNRDNEMIGSKNELYIQPNMNENECASQFHFQLDILMIFNMYVERKTSSRWTRVQVVFCYSRMAITELCAYC